MGKNKKGVAGNEQDKSERKPKKSKKNEEESRKGLPRRTRKLSTKNQVAWYFERRPAKKLRRMLRSNHPSEAYQWAARTGSIATLSMISREKISRKEKSPPTRVSVAAKAALESKGRMWRKKLVGILRSHSSHEVSKSADGYLNLLHEIAGEQTKDGELARAAKAAYDAAKKAALASKGK